jgi:hypothetical protein
MWPGCRSRHDQCEHGGAGFQATSQGSATVASTYVEGKSACGDRDTRRQPWEQHTINLANASAIEQENGNDWHSVSVMKLKHTAAS